MSERLDDEWLRGHAPVAQAPYGPRPQRVYNSGTIDLPAYSFAQIGQWNPSRNSYDISVNTIYGGLAYTCVVVAPIAKTTYGYAYFDGGDFGVLARYKAGVVPFFGQSIGPLANQYEGCAGVPGWMTLYVESEANRLCRVVNLW